MQALHIYAGPEARALLQREGGLSPAHVGAVAGAAGGPKGLMLGRLDRFMFGDWLPKSTSPSTQPVALIGASIGAWRMATACLSDSTAAFARLEHDYIHQHYALEPGQTHPTAKQVSTEFGANLALFFGGRVPEVLNHPRYRVHIIAARGQHILRREGRLRTPLGYAGAFFANALHRPALGAWLERVVFSSGAGDLPFATHDFRSRQLRLDADNFMPALQASCSIPFVLEPVRHIPGAPTGCYWDGGLTDYHLHLHYRVPQGQVVLYPHFQKTVVPGWLDKGLKWRHKPTSALDHMIVLAPNPAWVAQLPNGKLPDRTDFTRYGQDLAARVRVWDAAVSASQQLADEWAAWLEKPDVKRVQAL